MNDYKEIAKLERKGFAIEQFTRYHFRVNGRFDIFTNDRGRAWRWFDLVTRERGWFSHEEIPHRVPHYIQAHPEPELPAVAPIAAGWWNCSLCPFKMRDDGSAAAARSMSEHLDSHGG